METDDLPPTSAQRQIREAYTRHDFATACKIVTTQARSVARETRKQMQETGTDACPEFWDRIALEAIQARQLCVAYQGAPVSCLRAALEENGLHYFAEALIGARSWDDLVF